MSRNWKAIALEQRMRSDRSEQRVSDLQHALNLIALEIIDWFTSYIDKNGQLHEFGIGAAMNVSIDRNLMNPYRRGDTENRVIVFWRTLHNENQLISAYSREEFERLPALLSSVGGGSDTSQLQCALRKALIALDAAATCYIQKRCPSTQITLTAPGDGTDSMLP